MVSSVTEESCWRCDCPGCPFCLTYDESVELDYCACPDPWDYDEDEDY